MIIAMDSDEEGVGERYRSRGAELVLHTWTRTCQMPGQPRASPYSHQPSPIGICIELLRNYIMAIVIQIERLLASTTPT